MSRGFLALVLLWFSGHSSYGIASPPELTLRQYEEDFDFFWNEIHSSYAYFDKKSVDWDKVRENHRPRLKDIETREQFVGFLEIALDELYDHHAHLNTNTASSWRLVPSGADTWATWRSDKAIIVQVRPGSNAERAGLKAGMEILSIGDIEVGAAVNERMGKALAKPDLAARDWALRVLLAGRHNQERRLEVRTGDDRKKIAIVARPTANSQSLISHKRLGDNSKLGYIRINNSLGSNDLIKEFDGALHELKDCAGLILDLRDTPSGGNSTVARGILSRFIDRDGFYQKHSIPEEERRFGVRRSWVEIVSPRGEFTFAAPVVVLVDHWTGSMGEGIAIGLDGLKRATVVGTEMAGLLGATYSITLPNSKIGVNFPAEKLFHVNGTPREDFRPTVLVDLLNSANQRISDCILDSGIETLRSQLKNSSR